MPFTVSHAAAVLPLRRTALVFSALVVGSMAPDFPYFLFFRPGNRSWHTPHGALFFALPTALMVLLAFHAFMKQPLLALVPESHEKVLRRHAAGFGVRSVGHFAVIVLSLAIGIVTHIVWDAFTHGFEWGVRLFPLLRTRVLQVGDNPWPIYKLLQHFSSVFGFAILAYVYLRWFKREGGEWKRPSRVDWRRAEVLALILILAMVPALLYGVRHAEGVIEGYTSRESYFGRMLIFTMSFTAAGILLYGLLWHVAPGLRAFLSEKEPEPKPAAVRLPSRSTSG